MRPLRIVIVEDDAAVGGFLTRLLVNMGHDVCALEQTVAGAAAAAHHPDLVIIDARLAGGDDVDARGRIDPVAHLFISGAGGEIRMWRSGPRTIQAPCLETDLIQAITRALGRSLPGNVPRYTTGWP